MNTIKSISPVQKPYGWAVRVRFMGGMLPLFSPAPANGHRLTLAEAQATAQALIRDIARHGASQELFSGYAA